MAERLEVGTRLKDGIAKDIEKPASAIARFVTNAKARLTSLGSVITSTKGLLIGLGGALVLRKLGGVVTSFAAMADQVGKLSTRLGLSTEFLSRMAFVGERSNITFQQMSVGIQRFSRRLSEFQRTGRGTAQKGFEILGIEEFARNAKNAEEIMPILAKRFQELGDSTASLEAAFAFFDSEGVGFLQFLKDGPAALLALQQEADRLGITLSKDATNAAAAFNDAMTNLGSALEGFKRSALTPLLPPLTDMINTVTEFFIDRRPAIVQGLTTITHGAIEFGKGIIDTLPNVTTIIDTLGKAILGLSDGFLGAVQSMHEFRAAFNELLVSSSEPFDFSNIANHFGIGLKPGERFESLAEAAKQQAIESRLEAERIAELRQTIKELGLQVTPILGRTQRPTPGPGPIRDLDFGEDTASPQGGFREFGVGFGRPPTSSSAPAQSTGRINRASESDIDFLFQRNLEPIRERNRQRQLDDLLAMSPEQLENVVAVHEIPPTPKESAEAYAKALQEANGAQSGLLDGLKRVRDAGVDTFTNMSQAVTTVFGSLENNLTNFLVALGDRTKKVSDLIKGLVNSILKDIARVAARSLVRGLLGSVAGGLGGLFGGAGRGFRFGGVGHHGPEGEEIVAHNTEAHVPLPDGRTIPVTLRGGRGGAGGMPTVVVNMTVHATDAQSFDSQFAASSSRMRDELAAVVTSAIQRDPMLRAQF